MKRFTETEKWRDTWFRKLQPLSKLAFIYIVDTCDVAGVWDPDFELANFAIGENVEWSNFPNQEFGDRIKILPNGKWYLTRFLDFQYGKLSAECRPHARVLQLIQTHGIDYNERVSHRVSNGVSIPPRTRQDRKGSGIEGLGVQGEGAGAAVVTAEQIYEAYPRKTARQDALKAIGKAMLLHTDPPKLLAATEAYSAAVAKWPEHDRKFVPHPATWYNRGSYDDDPETWKRDVNGSGSRDKQKAGFA